MRVRALGPGDVVLGPGGTATRVLSALTSDGLTSVTVAGTDGEPAGLLGGGPLKHSTRVVRLASRVGPTLLDLGRKASEGLHRVDVTDPAYGARGDGITDDTTAIRAAIRAAGPGGEVWFPPGTYLVVPSPGSPALTITSPVHLRGSGSRVSELVLPSSGGGDRIVDIEAVRGVVVEDLGFIGRPDSGPLSAIHTAERQSARSLVVSRCRFRHVMPGGTDPLHAGVYVWPSDGVRIQDCEFEDCGRAIVIDQPDGEAVVTGNRIDASTRDVMSTGIAVRRGSGASDSKILISGNTIRGATLDPGGVGAEGHAISVFRARDARVIGNHCLDSGRGILISHEAFGAVVQGNVCTGNNDAGIRCEPQISTKSTGLGSGAARGVVITGNASHHNVSFGAVSGANSGIGIAISYAAATVVSDNLVHHNSGSGIVCDSDRVTITGNQSFNNYTGFTTEPTNGRRAGIRVYVGEGCTIVGNQCFDSQDSPTQMYGLSLSSSRTGHVVVGNNFEGNGVGEIFGATLIRSPT